MGYYEGEKSIGLMPILLTLSVVTMIGFGLLYFVFGRDLQPAGSQDMSTVNGSASAPAAKPTAQPVNPVLEPKAHNHA